MEQSGATTRYRIVHRDADSGAEEDMGVWIFGPDGRIVETTTEPRFEEMLADVTEEMNAMAGVHVEAPPPKGAPQFAVASRLIPRGAPGFLDGLREHLRRYYNVELVAA